MSRYPDLDRLIDQQFTETTDDGDKRYQRLMAAFTELQEAAQKVVDETDRIHGNDPWPLKYRAPYGAIVELRHLLAKQYGSR